MRKGLLYVGAGLILIGASIRLVTQWYVQTDHRLAKISEKDLIDARSGRLQEQSPAANPAIDPGRPVRLAIGSLGITNENENKTVGDLLTAALTNTKGLDLVERNSLDKALKELELSLSGLVRAQDAVRVGKLLRADWFVLGSPATVSGTNSIVVRIVDARTGIMRDGAVFPRGLSLPELASSLARFVREVRTDASAPRPQVYVALGAFEDLSLNNREASLQEDLRGFLTAAYQKGRAKLLEREFVDTLLQETRLDLAGLSADSMSNAPTAMQSAYWLVDGFYISSGKAAREVELAVNIRRIFGLTRHITFRDAPGEPLWNAVRKGIDRVLAEGSTPLVPTKNGEIQAQLSRGVDLTHMPLFDVQWTPLRLNFSPEEEIKRRRNIEEAIRAFRTVLLLDPEHREAKMYLAALLRCEPINQVDEARDYYRELIESPVQDRWSTQARTALMNSWLGRPVPERLRWFTQAAQGATNSHVSSFYQQQIADAKAWTVLNQTDTPPARALAEQLMFDGIAQWEKQIRANDQVLGRYVPGMEQLVQAFGTNDLAAGERMAELLPQLQQQHPNLAPHLLAAVLAHQVNTNTPLVSQFESSVKQASEQPATLFGPHNYFEVIRDSVVPWSLKHKVYRISTEALRALQSAASQGYAQDWKDQDGIALGFSEMLSDRWQEALVVFESFTNKPVFMPESGPWGHWYHAALPGKQANYCRQKLGVPAKTDPRELAMDKPSVCLHGPNDYGNPDAPTVASGIGDNEVWLCDGLQLTRLDSNLQTNLVLTLPNDRGAPATCICSGPDKVWVGTAGAGIFEWTRATKAFRRITDSDGLLMNHISQLCLAGESLWIGFSQDRYSGIMRTGGLGRMNLRTGEVVAFSPSLKTAPDALRSNSFFPRESGNEPPRLPVGSITIAENGDVWFLTHSGSIGTLRQFQTRNNVWDAAQDVSGCSDLAMDGPRLILGHAMETGNLAETKGSGLGVSIREGSSGKWRNLPSLPGFPEGWVTALKMADGELWVGGMGYLAAIDPATGDLHRFAYLSGPFVERIDVMGGFVWAQFDRHLYRAQLSKIN